MSIWLKTLDGNREVPHSVVSEGEDAVQKFCDQLQDRSIEKTKKTALKGKEEVTEDELD